MKIKWEKSSTLWMRKRQVFSFSVIYKSVRSNSYRCWNHLYRQYLWLQLSQLGTLWTKSVWMSTLYESLRNPLQFLSFSPFIRFAWVVQRHSSVPVKVFLSPMFFLCFSLERTSLLRGQFDSNNVEAIAQREIRSMEANPARLVESLLFIFFFFFNWQTPISKHFHSVLISTPVSSLVSFYSYSYTNV